MAFKIDSIENGIVIHLQDKFDFSKADEFKQAYESQSVDEYIVDFRKTDYMDSSGLGMLLNMKRSLDGKAISLVNCKSQIKKILVISRFDDQFHIS